MQIQTAKLWREGKLTEISPFGTGFIDDLQTRSCFGFHVTMLPNDARPKNPESLDGSFVRFNVNGAGIVESVRIAVNNA